LFDCSLIDPPVEAISALDMPLLAPRDCRGSCFHRGSKRQGLLGCLVRYGTAATLKCLKIKVFVCFLPQAADCCGRRDGRAMQLSLLLNLWAAQPRSRSLAYTKQIYAVTSDPIATKRPVDRLQMATAPDDLSRTVVRLVCGHAYWAPSVKAIQTYQSTTSTSLCRSTRLSPP
jgi:hypothetical protein